jgi:short-subunit dehydrogenase
MGVPHTHAGAYTASKHAVLGMSDVLRHELPDFIKVSVLCPGIVPSRLGEAARNRPDRFGGPETGGQASPVPSGLGLSPDEIGRRVLDGMQVGAFYIVTHPPVRELVDERYAEMTAAFDRQAPRFEGDERLDTRAVMRRRRP